jgi:hypothetical protein
MLLLRRLAQCAHRGESGKEWDACSLRRPKRSKKTEFVDAYQLFVYGFAARRSRSNRCKRSAPFCCPMVE